MGAVGVRLPIGSMSLPFDCQKFNNFTEMYFAVSVPTAAAFATCAEDLFLQRL